MSNYILSCCSTADLTQEHFDSRDIHYVCFHFQLDDKVYPDDLGKSISFDEFYQAMADGADTKTSQVNVEEFLEYFEPFLKEGKDILHLSLSSGISGVYNSACVARNVLTEKYPDRKIIVIDSLNACSGYGLLMDKLADLRDEGMDIDTLAKWAEDNKLNIHTWVIATDLKYLVRGGRVSKTSGMVGNMLNICPVITLNVEGKLVSRMKVRTKKKVIQAVADKMKELAQDRADYSEKCYIAHAACYEDAKTLADVVEAAFPKMNGKVQINTIGTVIGSHTGPGTLVLFFWGDERVD
ncbi:MAG: DegV family protein [Lachnospiraceae bacterium]|nr:DegV family protein [Lachnospiraceae bacterium]